MFLADLSVIKILLTKAKTIAVVGLSTKESRPSNMVTRYLIEAGYTVIPVNPGQEEILGLPCYPSLTAIPGFVDIVNIFRRSEEVPPIVAEAIAIEAGAVWMQEGVIHDGAALKAKAAGLVVVMNSCLKMVHQGLVQEVQQGKIE
jgi:predicted CoA-binding protein